MAKDHIDSGREHLQQGDNAIKSGDMTEGRLHYEAALLCFRGPKLLLGEAHARRGLAAVALGEGSFVSAHTQVEVSIDSFRSCIHLLDKIDSPTEKEKRIEADAKEGLATTLMLSSEVLSKLKRDSEADVAMEQAKAMFMQIGTQSTPAAFYITAGRIAMRNGEMKEAETQMRNALKVFKGDQDRSGEVSALLQMAELHRLQLKLHKAEEALNLARSIVSRLEQPSLMARVWMALGGLHLQAMRLEKARACYQRALPIFRSEEATEREGYALLGLGEVESRDGEPKALQTILAGARCLIVQKKGGGALAAMLGIGEHGLRNSSPHLALLSGECARRIAREEGKVLLQGQSMRIIVKALAVLRDSRGTLVAALAREAVAGDIQQNALDVAEYYRRRAPKQILAELDALSKAELLAHSERLVSRVLVPVLSGVDGELSALHDVADVLPLIERLGSQSETEVEDTFSEELTQEEDTKDFDSFDNMSEPPTEGSQASDEGSPVEFTDGAPPIKSSRTNEILDED